MRVVVMIVIINEGCRWWYRLLQGGRVGHWCKYVINHWKGWWPGKMKKIMYDPINVCTFSSAASWLQSLINLQLFFFVIVVLLLIWWWRGWWRWRLLKIVTAPKRSGFHSSLARGAQINFLASNRFPLIRLLLRWDPTFFFFKLSFL